MYFLQETRTVWFWSWSPKCHDLVSSLTLSDVEIDPVSVIVDLIVLWLQEDSVEQELDWRVFSSHCVAYSFFGSIAGPFSITLCLSASNCCKTIVALWYSDSSPFLSSPFCGLFQESEASKKTKDTSCFGDVKVLQSSAFH